MGLPVSIVRSGLVGAVSLSVLVPIPATAADEYEIEAASNDEKFIINGEIFEAKTYCIGWETGDMVVFIEGSAYGACASATLLNTRTEETCDVWCE
jgi:hypothetical protein